MSHWDGPRALLRAQLVEGEAPSQPVRGYAPTAAGSAWYMEHVRVCVTSTHQRRTSLDGQRQRNERLWDGLRTAPQPLRASAVAPWLLQRG